MGLDYILTSEKECTDYKISFNGSVLIIKDDFWCRCGDDYIDEKNIPTEVSESVIKLGEDFPIISLFGKPEISEGEKTITCHSDLIAATFFMLARWEEKACTIRDAHNRFPAYASLAFKNNFLNRPIVNEYVELIWALLKRLNLPIERKKYSYTIVPTHDVDQPFLLNGFFKNLRSLGGFMKRRDFKTSIAYTSKMINGIDPWDTHSLFMDKSESKNVKSHFFFMSGGNTKYDNRYSIENPKILKLIEEIKKRNHQIGYHPSYNAYKDIDQFREEKKALEKATKQPVMSGRQHYLRFENPKTWQVWETNEMEWDSTMSFADCSGFRCGICYPFPVYDLENRAQLNLKERPLIVMEASILHYQNLSTKQAIEQISTLKNEVKKYNGEFVFLHHNSSFFIAKYEDGHEVLQSFYS